ncbi:MAG: hypothetical protein RI932_1946, partial [Pseudomonadota bacterium]
YATLADKDWQLALQQLCEEVDAVHLTQTQSPRAVHLDDLIHYTSSTLKDVPFRSHSSSSEAFAEGLKSAQQSEGSLFVLGSITLLGEAMEFFSIPVFPEQGSTLS